MSNKLKPNVISKINLWSILNKKHNHVSTTNINFLSQLNYNYKTVTVGLLKTNNILPITYTLALLVPIAGFIVI